MRRAPLVTLRSWLLTSPPRCGSVRLACIDGAAGSGKTTLAALLHEVLPDSVVLHMDDLYDGWGQDLGGPLAQRVTEWILDPWARGSAAHARRFDWATQTFGREYELGVPSIAILEGCGSASASVRPRASLVIWRDSDPAVRLTRGLIRDGAQMSQEWRAWQEKETRHFEEDRTLAAAHFVLADAPWLGATAG
jgi:hypothetical protein